MSQDKLVWRGSATSFTQELQDRFEALAQGESLLLVFADSGSVGVQHPGRTYEILLDTDYDTGFVTDISHLVDDVQWHIGMYDQWGKVAPPAQCRLVLHDPGGAFSRDRSPGTTLGGDLVGMMVEIAVVVQRVRHVVMRGWITNIAPHDRQYGRVTEITLADKMEELYLYDYRTELRRHVTVSEEIDKVFATIGVVYPYTRNAWIVGASTLGADAALLLPDTEIETSQRVLPWVGDTSDRGGGVSAYGYIQDLVAAEIDGRLFSNRLGKFEFHDVNHDARESVKVTITDADIDDFGINQSRVFNQALVTYYPRAVGVPNSVLYANDSTPVRIRASDEYSSVVRYFDPDNENARVGGLDIRPLAVGVDYRATRAEEDDSEDVSRRMQVSMDAGATEAEITITNPLPYTVYLQVLQVRGTPVVNYRPEDVIQRDPVSIYQYGVKEAPAVDLRLADSEDSAQAFIDHVLFRNAHQFTFYEWVQMDIGGDTDLRDSLAGRILPCSIGDAIRVQNNVSGHDQEYIIVGEEHHVQGRRHTVTWFLRIPLTREVWVLGEDALGAGAVLGI